MTNLLFKNGDEAIITNVLDFWTCKGFHVIVVGIAQVWPEYNMMIVKKKDGTVFDDTQFDCICIPDTCLQKVEKTS